MTAGLLGMMDTPAQGNLRPAGVTWAADNGCFSKGYPGDVAWLEWLSGQVEDRGTCLFAVAPDVVGDAAATPRAESSRPHLPTIRRLGFRAAFVAQNGLEDLAVPWGSFDALFIGGDTAWKLGAAARTLAVEAKAHGKWLHMGRVNSWRRFAYAAHIDCDSGRG